MTTTSTEPAARRFPAEWEPVGAVMVAWPHAGTDWAYMLDEVQQCYSELIAAITRHAAAIVVAPDTSEPRRRLEGLTGPHLVIYFDVPTDDTWTRDYGVLTAEAAGGSAVLCDFGFNAWGGKFAFDRDNAVTKAMADAGLLCGAYDDCRDFILEGGSIESDGRGTAMVTEECLLTPTRNPGCSRADIERRLACNLGIRKVLWLKGGGIIGDDTDGHVDTLARLAPGNVIIYATPAPGADDAEQVALLDILARSVEGLTDADGRPFSLIGMPLPQPIYDPADGSRLPATYLNYLVVNDAVLLPSYGQPMGDLLAEQIIRVAYPDHTVERVDCRALVRQHGSLHCATMQIPPNALPI